MAPVLIALYNSYKLLIRGRVINLSPFKLLREEGYRMLLISVRLKLRENRA